MPFELDTKALRYFAAVAAHRSYTRAAASLRITQPAVTRQVQAVERAFGVRLFRRQGVHVVPTEAGEALLAHARDILHRIDAASEVVKGAAGQPTGRVSIGAPSATGEDLLPRVLVEFRRKYPRVFVHVVTGYTGDLVEMLAHDRLDLALVFGDPSHGDLELQPLFEVPLGVIGPGQGVSDDPLAGRVEIPLAEAAALPLILPTATQPLRRVVDQACRDLGLRPHVTMEADSLGISKALVRAGMGYMLMGERGVQREVEAGELRFVPLAPPAIPWPVSIATRKAKSASLASRMMIQELLAHLRKA